MKKIPSCSAAITLGLVTSAAAQNVISWNIDSSGTIGGNGTAEMFGDHGSGGGGDFAGVVDAEWWGNSWNGGGQNFSPTNLADNAGNATSLDVTSNSGLSFSAVVDPGQDSDGKWNRNMLTGYQNNLAGLPVVLTLSQIPFSQYEIYVYFMSDVDSRVGEVAVGDVTYYFGADPTAASVDDPAGFVQTMETTTAGFDTDANYAVFSGLSGGEQEITVTFWTDNTATEQSFGGISGFQVVNTGTLPAIPVINGQPVDQMAAVDFDATFTCSAISDPAPEYQWEYSEDGVGGWTEIAGETFSTLELIFLGPGDEGFYRCVASNENGSDISDAAFLDVFYVDPEFLIQPESANAEVGSTLVLEADAIVYGTASYQWFKDGSPLEGETDSILTLSGVGPSDDGEYFLRVTDDIEPGLSGDSDSAFVVTFPSWSGLFSSDPFRASAGYVAGELPLQDPAIAGYTGPWTDVDFADAEPEVQPGSLTYADPMYLGSSGDKVGKDADAEGVNGTNAGRTYRELSPELKVGGNTEGARYLSFLYRNGNEGAADNPTQHSVLTLYHDTGGAAPAGDASQRSFYAGISDDFGTTNYAFRYNDVTVGDLGVPVDSDVHLFVVKFDLSSSVGSDSITVWIDPQLGSGDPAGGVLLSSLDVEFDSLAFSDYASNSVAWDELRWGSTFDSVTLSQNPGGDFAAWIALYPGVGDEDGFDDDPDGDGLTNGEENFFGTDPTVANQGVVGLRKVGDTFVFEHPENPNPASDVSAAYRWSEALETWNADGATADGITVTFSRSPDTPVAGTTTVTATISPAAPPKLFTDIEVTQEAR